MRVFNLIILLMILAPILKADAQTLSRLQSFRLAPSVNSSRMVVDRSFSTIDSIPLNLNHPVSGLAISGWVKPGRGDGFARVLMVDTEGKEYLVLEMKRLYADVDSLPLSDYCEETMRLMSVIPTELRVFADNCVLEIDEVTWLSSNVRQDASGNGADVFDNSYRRTQCQSVVDRINEYNEAHNKLWRAGVTEVALLPWESRKRVLGIDGTCDTYGFEYYWSGIFEMGEPSTDSSSPPTRDGTSPYVDHFDWRDRHGINWMTPVRNQGNSGGCWAFAAIGVTEALVNLYYNQKLDFDLSEQEIISCTGDVVEGNTTYPNSYRSGFAQCALQHIIGHGVSEDTSFQFVDSLNVPCENKGSFNEQIFLKGRHNVLNYNTHNRDSVKKALIKYGPLAGTVYYRKGNFLPIKHKGHSMTLVGYGTIHAGDTIRVYDYNDHPQSEIILENDERIGMTYWIFKNSYGPNSFQNGYVYAFFNNYASFGTPYYATTPVYSLLLTDADIAVTDTDGDGYFYWGVGNKPAHCPNWVPDEPDGDDSDYAMGPMNQYGYLYDLASHVNDVETIAASTTWSQKRYIYDNIVIPNGVTLSITDDVVFYNGARITLQGGTLDVNGGHLSNATIIVNTQGSHIAIRNNGSIYNAAGKSFNMPKGSTMQMNCGTIK